MEKRIESACYLFERCERAEGTVTSDSGVQVPAETRDIDALLFTCSPLTRYCVKRLVKGLSSSRESARQGFSLALSGIITIIKGKSDSIVSGLLDYMSKTFSKKEGQEVIGFVFGIGSIVKSNIAFSRADVASLVSGLMELAGTKSFVKEACMEIVISLAYQIKDDSSLIDGFFSCEALTSVLESSPEDPSSSPESVTLTLRLWPMLPKDIAIRCPIIPGKQCASMDLVNRRAKGMKKFSNSDLKVSQSFFTRDNLTKVHSFMGNTTYSHPRLHSSWEALLNILIPGYGAQSIKSKVDLGCLNSFWSIFVENDLFDSPSHEKKYLGITIFKTIVPCLEDEAFKAIITQKFIRCLGNNVNKQTYLNKAANQAAKLLADYLKSLPSKEANDVISRINKYSGSQLMHFFKNISNGLPDEKSIGVLTEIIESLKVAGTGDMSYLYHLSKIPGILKKYQNEPQSCQELFKGLVDAYVGEINTTEGDESDNPKIKIMGSLMNGLGTLSKGHNAIESLVSTELEILDYLNSKSKEDQEKKPAASLVELRALISANMATGDSKKIHHFLHLVCLLELYSFANSTTVDEDMTNDLQNIFKECFPDKKNRKAKQDDIFWADVLVDCVLSIISRNEAPYPSAPLRDAGELLFRNFTGDLTSNGLSSLIDILLQALDAPQGHDENSEDEEMEEDGENPVTLTESDMEDDKEMEEEADEEEVSDMDEDLPDATDEQMFKMDSILGAYFASHANLKSKKQLREDLINFKLRVISCLEIFMRLNPDSILLLEVPEALLSSLAAVSRPDGPQVLQERLIGLIKNKLVKCRCQDITNAGSMDEDVIEQQLRKSLYLASRSPIKSVADAATSAYIFLQKALHQNCRESLQNVAKESMNAALSDYFSKKKSKLTKAFFPVLFKKVPDLASTALPTLINQCKDARSPYLKTEACIMLGNVIQVRRIVVDC